MGILSWILFGLIVGALARLIMPGRHRMGCMLTIGLGIVGSLVGGFIGRALGLYGNDVSWGGFWMSLLGAIIVLAVVGQFSKSREQP